MFSYSLALFSFLCCCHISFASVDDNYIDVINNEDYPRKLTDLKRHFYNDKSIQWKRLFSKYDLLEMSLFPYPPPTDQVIRNKGYPCEIHDITTEDGYILRVFRIPYGRKGKEKKSGRPPLLLQHGILASSDCWILSDPSRALAFRLADEGYDVWIGNSRGTTYSKKHKTLSVNDPKYWNFSIHELGTKDLPAVIDYMLNSTGFEKITYVAHSQGTTQFFILTSVLPKYNDKILVMSALAPVAFLNELNGLPLMLSHISKLLKLIANTFGLHDILDRPAFIHIVNHIICRPGSIFVPVCEFWYFVIAGFDYAQLDKNLIEDISDYCPAGCSVNQLIHFSQFTKGRFSWFDYGPEGNLRAYNSTVPPQYNLTQITAPVILHYATNDYIATVPEVQKLYWILPNVAGIYRVPYEKFNHVDFMWATDVNKLLYNQAIDAIKQFL